MPTWFKRLYYGLSVFFLFTLPTSLVFAILAFVYGYVYTGIPLLCAFISGCVSLTQLRILKRSMVNTHEPNDKEEK